MKRRDAVIDDLRADIHRLRMEVFGLHSAFQTLSRQHPKTCTCAHGGDVALDRTATVLSVATNPVATWGAGGPLPERTNKVQSDLISWDAPVGEWRTGDRAQVTVRRLP
jgi:hypothetical protein